MLFLLNVIIAFILIFNVNKKGMRLFLEILVTSAKLTCNDKDVIHNATFYFLFRFLIDERFRTCSSEHRFLTSTVYMFRIN